MSAVKLSTPGGELCILDISGAGVYVQPPIVNTYILTICHQGVAEGSCNLLPVKISEKDFAINMPGQIVMYENVDDNFRATVIMISPAFMESLGFSYNFGINRMIDSHPVIPLTSREYEASLGYFRMVEAVMRNNHRFHLEILRHITCAYLYGFAHKVTDEHPKIPSSADDILVGKFFDVLKKNYRTSRSVKFYADSLCVTPGYLAAVTRRVTGKTVREWISKYVTLDAMALLSSTGLSVQQISYKLHFSDQSFFGKYFKKAIGKSPVEYRTHSKTAIYDKDKKL